MTTITSPVRSPVSAPVQAVTGAVGNPNLIQNGSFEEPSIAAGTFEAFGSIPGWTAISGGQIEIWHLHNGVVPSNGNQCIELDYLGARDGLSQTVATEAGASYALSLYARPRDAGAVATAQVEIVWNGALAAVFSPTSMNWTRFEQALTGTGSDTLTIREVQTQSADGFGALIDDVRLVKA